MKLWTFMLLVVGVNLSFAQTKGEHLKGVQEQFEAINADSAYQVREILGEDLGEDLNEGLLEGYYKANELKKAVFSFGKSNGFSSEEYYYKDNKLFFVLESERSFYYDVESGWNYDSIPKFYEARYYFSNGALVEVQHNGTPFDNAEKDDSIKALVYLEEAAEYAERLKYAKVKSKAYDVMLSDLLDHSVSEILVNEIDPMDSTITFLDAREYDEYKVSHIKGAIWVGYDDFDMTRLDSVAKSNKIVVYCSVGYRSEKVSEKLVKAKYENVSNLYGSIFEWVNQGRPVYDTDGNVTTNVHAFDKEWGRWLKQGTKVY